MPELRSALACASWAGTTPDIDDMLSEDTMSDGSSKYDDFWYSD